MNTIQINLLETKQIAAYVNGYSYALEGGYHIVAGEANATQFQLVSVPEQYEKATFYVNMINSQHKMVKEKLSVSLNGKFILPVGMAIAGYGQLIFSCNFNGETVIWVPLKVKVWNTRADWEIDTLSIPQDTLKRLEEAEGRINKLEDELIHPTTTFSIFRVGKTDIYASEGENTLTLLAGDNITLEANEVDDSIKISATGGTAEYPPATEDTDGLMSADDKKNLDDIVSVFGSEAGDPDLLVNTIREILEIFENYPEGLNLQTELTNVKRTANSALQPKDVKIRTEDFCRYTEKVRKSILKPTEGMKAGKETTIEIYDEIESENEIEFPSDELPNISFDGRRIEGNYSGDDGKIEWNIIPIYNEAGKYVIHVFAVITWNSDTSSGVIEVPYDEVSTHDVSGGNFEFPLEKGSIITFHGFKNELESDKHLVIEGTRIRAEGYTDFASGYVTLVAGKNIGIAQEGNKFTIIGADIPDVPKNVVTTDTEQLISGEKTFTSPVKIDGDSAYLTVGSVDNGYISVENEHIIKGDRDRRQSFVLNIQNKSGTIALTDDIPDISGLAEKTEVEAVKKTAETAQSTANSAKTAAQNAQNAANASLQPEDVTIIAEQDSGDLRLPIKKGTNIFLHGFSADIVSNDSISIDGTRLKASETSQDPIGGDITLRGEGIIRIAQVASEFVFSASLPDNLVTTDTEQEISGEKTFTGLGGIKVKDMELGDTTQISPSSITVGFGNSEASSENPVKYLVINPFGIYLNEDMGSESGDSIQFSYPEKSGTLALKEDIPTNHVTTDTEQTIKAQKVFSSSIVFGQGITTQGFLFGSTQNGIQLLNTNSNPSITKWSGNSFYTLSLPSKNGTIALTNDIPTNYVTTDTKQDVKGDKTFKGNVTFGDFNTRGLGVNPNGIGFSVYVDGLGYQVNFQEREGTIALDEDIPNWARTESKPEYSWGEINDKPTDLASTSYVDTKIAGIVNSAPETLDTLAELAKALGDDPNFATTMSTELGKRALKTDLSNYLPLSGGTLTNRAQIWRTGKSQAWWNGREGAVLVVSSSGKDQYCPIFSEKSVNGSWEFGSFNDTAHLVYISDSDYETGNNVKTADYKFPQDKSGTVALEEDTLRKDQFLIHITNPKESTTTSLDGRVNFEFHGFDFYKEESGGIKNISVDGTRITANGAPDGFISGDITFKGSGITIAQAGKEITFSAVAPPVTSVNTKTGDVTLGKGDVGLSNVANERQYSASNPPPWSKITGTENVALKTDIPTVPTNYVTTNTTQDINGAKTFTSAVTINGTSAYLKVGPTSGYIQINPTFIAKGDTKQSFTYNLPSKNGTIALTSDIPTVPTNKAIGNLIYPVGAYYISNSSTSPTSLFGGSWTSVTGRFLYCNAGTGTGGSNTHRLTVSEMPSHNHGVKTMIGWGANTTGDGSVIGRLDQNGGNRNQTWATNCDNTGGGSSFSIMPAYQTVYAWRRTALAQ